MDQKYEYKFVRLGEGLGGVKDKAVKEYQNVIEENARNGWRLVQVFAPSLAAYGTGKFIEVIFEKEVG